MSRVRKSGVLQAGIQIRGLRKIPKDLHSLAIDGVHTLIFKELKVGEWFRIVKSSALINHTSFPDDLVRDVIRFTRPSGAGPVDIIVRESVGWKYANAYFYRGWKTAFTRTRPSSGMCRRMGGTDTIEAKVPGSFEPFVGHHIKGGPAFTFRSRLDVLVYELAHEQRHLWQSHRKGRSGYLCLDEEKLSEMDADLWAERKLEAWRCRMFKGLELWVVGLIGPGLRWER